jgi:hypothetical protein
MMFWLMLKLFTFLLYLNGAEFNENLYFYCVINSNVVGIKGTKVFVGQINTSILCFIYYWIKLVNVLVMRIILALSTF